MIQVIRSPYRPKRDRLAQMHLVPMYSSIRLEDVQAELRKDPPHTQEAEEVADIPQREGLRPNQHHPTTSVEAAEAAGPWVEKAE